MIPTDVIGRVFCLRSGSSAATGFAVDVDQRQYIVTARHFGSTVTKDAPLLLLFGEEWHNLDARVVGHAPGEIDISVFALGGLVSKPELELVPDQAIIYGQDVYFLGFPHGSWGGAGKASVGRPLPFVRKAIVSCVEGPEGAHRNYLAGHNVNGFSGGPVIYSWTPPRGYRVTSVVSAYRYVESPLFAGGQQLDAHVRENTGVIITYGIRHAIDLIRANPIGVKTSAA